MRYKKKYKSNKLSKGSRIPLPYLKAVIKNNYVRHGLLVIVVAACIGVLLGTLLLHLLIKESEQVVTKDNGPVSIIDEKKDENKPEDEKESQGKMTVDPFQLYVVQAGVFEDRENAENFSGSFIARTPVVIREEEGVYYVLLGVATTSEIATTAVENRLDKDTEVFVKKWEIDEVEGNQFNEEEIVFLNELQQSLLHTLKTIESGEELSLSIWVELLEKHKLADNNLSTLVTYVDEQVLGMDEKELERLEVEQVLLNILIAYERLLHNVQDRPN